MHARAQLGQKGETAAAEFLVRHGFTILTRNYHCPYGEIDIIASKKDQISFVEVKTRRNLNFDIPAAAVTPLKQKKIRACALHYLQTQDVHANELAFDVIEILVTGDTAKLHWLPNCF